MQGLEFSNLSTDWRRDVTGLEPHAVYEIGVRYAMVGQPHTKKLYGWAELTLAQVTKHNLVANCDYDPHRHVDLIGWPEEKDRQMSIAQELAADADLVLKAEPGAALPFVFPAERRYDR